MLEGIVQEQRYFLDIPLLSTYGDNVHTKHDRQYSLAAIVPLPPYGKLPASHIEL
jgi:hypothetical protein